MSEAVSALGGQVYAGLATIREAGPHGMVTVRGDLGATALRDICSSVAGVAFPKANRAELSGKRGLCWMSPDEVLVLLPHAEAADAVNRIADAMSGTHHLAVDVSDARALFHVDGPAAREVLAKLTPADLRPAAFGPGALRRTRLAQVPAAVWMRTDTDASVVCFRSVARYVFDILAASARPGGAVGYF